ncbi:hypothetical protein COY07_05865 [Candidatus Peregrinibacteria bacterium CG_4_10_14_0_2_um_filter_43_11]|nr:MAG: hypothetical protein COY07_05865 [Candidatus Peregrinibacteria bacterium CG_4_10_14_0_2_um_filter_43_11]
MIYVLLFVLGISLGSFASVVIHRLHMQERGIFWGRSKCPHCENALRPMDLIPVISFLLNKFKCHFCKKPILARYPLIEISMGVFFLLTAKLVGLGNIPLLVFYLIVTFAFVLLTFYDILFQEIPDSVSIPTALLSIAAILSFGIHSINQTVIGLAVPIFFFGALFFFSKGSWLGGGDIRIGAIMGALLGWPDILTGLFLGYLFGALFSLIGIAIKKLTRKSHIPFAPFLLLGTYITIFWSQAILNWYLGIS